MFISTYGSRFYGGQIDRIESGFLELGHIVNSNHSPNLIYSNDMAHVNDAIGCWKQNQSSKLIFNILDCPTWVPDWINIKSEWYNKLRLADKVTCISKTVQKDILDHFDINAEVIYNPIKPVYPLNNEARSIFCLFVGRALAPNKRVLEIIYPLYTYLSKVYKNANDMIHFVGSENPGFGTFHGIVSDEKLNELYNNSAFTLISSKWEGLNLPLIESICCGSIPIVCKDMSTAEEFSPPECLCDPSTEGMIDKLRDIKFLSQSDKICSIYGKKYREQFSPVQIAKNILQVYGSMI